MLDEKNGGFAPLVFEKDILIRSEQVDMTRRLRISEMFMLLEKASIAHTEELGCTRHKTLDRGLLWIITRQSLEVSEWPEYDENITVRSWQGDMMHVFFPRFYEVLKDGKTIARGEALWMLIDEKTREMIMPEEYGISIPGAPGAGDMMIPPVRMPEGGALLEKELTAEFSRIDINGHMNNARYFDLIDDETEPQRLAGVRPKKITANYVNELKLGERFIFRAFEKDDVRYYEGASDKIKFRISMEF